MKHKLLQFSIFYFLFSILNSPAQTLDWARGMGSTDQDVGLDIAADNNYRVYTVGMFRGTVDFDPGNGTHNLTGISANSAIFVQALTGGGDFLWANRIACSDDMQAFSIATDASANVYVTGHFTGVTDFDPTNTTLNISPIGDKDCYIVKYNSNGALVWVKTFGGANDDIPRSIYVDAAGNIYTTGTFTGTVDFDPGNGTHNLANEGLLSGFVQKLDANGDFVWAIMNTRVGAAMQCYSIEADALGNVYIGGAFSGTMNFNHAGGGYNLTATGGYDIFVQKLDSDGNFVWAKAMGGASTDFCNSISLGEAGDVYTTGYFFATVDFDPGNGTANLTSAGSNDVFISKLDSAGNYKWAKRMGGSQTDIGQSIRYTNGHLYTAGRFEDMVDFNPNGASDNFTSAGNTDIFIHEMDTAGNYIQTFTFGAANADEAYGLYVDNIESIYTTGRYNGTFDFDPGPNTVNLTATTGTTGDVFVQKLTSIVISANENTMHKFALYPNPASTTLTIELAGGSGHWAVNILNAQGQLVGHSTFDIHHSTFDISQFPSGLYYLHLQSAEATATKKFEVIH